MGKTSIAFFDIEQMGPLSKFLVIVVIGALFAAVGKFFQKELF